MNAGRDWVARHLADAPPELLDAMLRAIPESPEPDPSRALALGAIALYSRVARGTGGREDALPLLAADALLTHAFEAKAMEDPTGVQAFALEIGAGGMLGAVEVA